MKGYMTVEASLVLPVVFWLLMFVLSLLVYTYDRCILEQDAASLIVGRDYDGQVSEELYREKYVWMEVAVKEQKESSLGASITMEGTYRGPFFETAEVQRRAPELSPTFLLRQKNKLERKPAEGMVEDENGVY